VVWGAFGPFADVAERAQVRHARVVDGDDRRGSVPESHFLGFLGGFGGCFLGVRLVALFVPFSGRPGPAVQTPRPTACRTQDTRTETAGASREDRRQIRATRDALKPRSRAPVPGWDVAHAELVELDHPPAALRIVHGGPMSFEVFVVVRGIDADQREAVAEPQAGVGQVAQGAKGVEHDRCPVGVLRSWDEPVEVSVDAYCHG